MNFKRICFSVLWAVFAVSTLSGQVPDASSLEPGARPGTDLNRILREFQQNRLQRELQREVDLADEERDREKVAEPDQPDVPKVTLDLKEIEFSPRSTVIPSDTLDKLAHNFQNRKVGIDELNDLVNKINSIYREGGYITAMAVLPPQQVKDGRVKIVLIEGKVGQVRLVGNKTTKESYVFDRVKIRSGDILSIHSIDKDLQWFNGTNDVRLRIHLQAGIEPGTTDYFIAVDEPEKNQFTIFSDSAGNKNTGLTRAGFSYVERSISNIRDSFTATILAAESSASGFLNYSIPISKKGANLSVYHSFNNLVVSENDTNAFNIKGKARTLGIGLNYPIAVKTGFKRELHFDVHRQKSENEVIGMKFVDDKEMRYSIGTSFLKIFPGEVIYFKPTFTYCNYEGLGSDKVARKFVADALWQKRNPHGQMVNVRLNGQKTYDEYLPSADQYYLGGLYSVRGYKESVIAGDSGLNMKFDYSVPASNDHRTQFFLFYDWGQVYGKTLLSTRFIHSTGYGITHGFSKNSTISLTAGYPLKDKVGDEKISSYKVDFALNVSF